MRQIGFDAVTAIVHVQNALNRFTVLSREKLKDGTQAVFREYAKRLTWIAKDFDSRLSEGLREAVRRDVVSDESAMQSEAVNLMYIALPPEERDRIESIIEESWKKYVEPKI